MLYVVLHKVLYSVAHIGIMLHAKSRLMFNKRQICEPKCHLRYLQSGHNGRIIGIWRESAISELPLLLNEFEVFALHINWQPMKWMELISPMGFLALFATDALIQ